MAAAAADGQTGSFLHQRSSASTAGAAVGERNDSVSADETTGQNTQNKINSQSRETGDPHSSEGHDQNSSSSGRGERDVGEVGDVGGGAASPSSNSSILSSLEGKIRAALNPSHLQLFDLSGGCGTAVEAVVVSRCFEGQRLLQRQRGVNAAIGDDMAKLHAFTMKCFTEEEWEAKKNRSR